MVQLPSRVVGLAPDQRRDASSLAQEGRRGSLQVGCGSGGQAWREGWAREARRPGPTHLSGHLVGEGRTARRFPGEGGDEEFKEAPSEQLDDFVLFSSSKGQWEGVW